MPGKVLPKLRRKLPGFKIDLELTDRHPPPSNNRTDAHRSKEAPARSKAKKK